MHTIALGLLERAGQELLRIPYLKRGHIEGLRSKVHHLLMVYQQANQLYIQEPPGHPSSLTMENYFHVTNSQLLQILSSFDN